MPIDPAHTDEQRTKRVLFRRNRLLIAIAGALWICGIAVGGTQLKHFETTPGAIAQTPPKWPRSSPMDLDPRRNTLVMLIHPQCSCSEASLSELAEVMLRAHGRINAWVLFAQAEGTPRGATWQAATRLADTQLRIDPSGEEASRFGAMTSGHVVLYDSSGRLLFSGGITGARGHAGENMGRNQLLAALDTTLPGTQRHPVFGCPIEGSDERREVLTSNRQIPLER
jgi:hypothetical protein